MKQLKKQIKDLESYYGYEDFNHAAVTDTISSLNDTLEIVSNNEYTREELTEYIFERDPLDYIDGVSDNFCDEVREIQHAIINYFS